LPSLLPLRAAPGRVCVAIASGSSATQLQRGLDPSVSCTPASAPPLRARPSFSAAARPTPTPSSQMRSLAEVTWRPTSTPTTTLDPHACVPAARFSDPQGLHPEPSAHAHNLLLVDNTGREAVRLPGNVARMTEWRLSSPGSSRRGGSCPEGSERRQGTLPRVRQGAGYHRSARHYNVLAAVKSLPREQSAAHPPHHVIDPQLRLQRNSIHPFPI
jgi:hypothetical protein